MSKACSARWRARTSRFGRCSGNTTAWLNIIAARYRILRREILRVTGVESSVRCCPKNNSANCSRAVGEEELEKAGRQIALAIIDDLWADYLANVAELKGGVHWASWGGRDPLFTFLNGEREIYEDFQQCFKDEIAEAFATAEIRDGVIQFQKPERFERGATWTYVTTDQPFGTLGERIMKAMRRKLSGR